MTNQASAQDLARSLDLSSAQTQHRLRLLKIWSVSPGSRILELGCGQGDCTEVIAHIVGETGHIDAVDPGPLDYGRPYTLGEAQSDLAKSYIGSRISFHCAKPLEWLDSVEEGQYDACILCHCLWYFSSAHLIQQTLEKLHGKAKKLLIAEWALKPSTPEAVPHLLAAMTRATCEAHIPDSKENIRTLIIPQRIREMAEEAGWRMVKEEVVTPEKELQDGWWEVNMVKDEEFLKRAEERVKSGTVVEVLRSMREAMMMSIGALGDGNVRCIDVWVAEFS